jgi:hypothetical protein
MGRNHVFELRDNNESLVNLPILEFFSSIINVRFFPCNQKIIRDVHERISDGLCPNNSETEPKVKMNGRSPTLV